MNNSKSGLVANLVLVFLLVTGAGIAQEADTRGGNTETKLKEIPADWPVDVPKPENLTDIGGWLMTKQDPSSKQKGYTIDLWGKSIVSGLDYFERYSSLLEKSGFEQFDYKQESDTVHARFKRGDQQISFGSDVVNAKTKTEYVEIGIMLQFIK